tara:strand:+ start:265 stop:567 length:303 start_codon:yes stop_codon:yes gene_type:complete
MRQQRPVRNYEIPFGFTDIIDLDQSHRLKQSRIPGQKTGYRPTTSEGYSHPCLRATPSSLFWACPQDISADIDGITPSLLDFTDIFQYFNRVRFKQILTL